MVLNFQQGIVTYPTTGALQSFLVFFGGYVTLSASNGHTDITFAHGDSDYLLTESATVPNAWGPLPANTDCWLYWDINLLTGQRTFGYTSVAPIHGGSQPTPQENQHWFDVGTRKMYVCTSNVYRSVIRVFAAKVNNATITPVGVGFAGRPFAGTQAGLTTANVPSGRIIVDDTGTPIRKTNGEFFTTESEFFVNGSPVNAVRLESGVIAAAAVSPANKFSVVKFVNFGQIDLADYDDVGATAIAMLLEDLATGEVGTVCVQGAVTNPDWSWATVGDLLWVSSAGQLTNVDPHVANAFVYPNGRVPVARVLSPTTVIFDQGLGGKGDRGDPGLSGGVQLANATTFGVSRLSVNPVDLNNPIAVGDNDPRLSAALLRTGGTMTGPLVLSGDPSAPMQAATKQYVDNATSGTSYVQKAGDTMTGLLVLSGDPVVALGAATKQYVDAKTTPYDIILTCSDLTTPLTTKALADRAVASRTITTSLFRADLLTASGSGSVTAIVRVDGSSVASLVIPAGSTSVSTPLVITIDQFSSITVEINTAGSGTIGLIVTILGAA